MAAKSEGFWVEHLLRRAGFGATPDELSYYKSLGFERSVDELLNPENIPNSALDDQLSREDFDYTDIGDLRRWWIYRMVYTKRPLEEKMALFWHGHFASSREKVGNAFLLYGQNQLLRGNALGNFRDLLMGVSKDPAMIVYLDNQQNRKGKPNENYAREVMELFTMGIGNYSEQDVKEAARAFTGWQAPQGFFFNHKQHDFGEKSFLGVRGFLDGTDVVNILSAKRETAHYICRKLIRFFVMDNPDEDMVEHVADEYIANGANIRPVLKAIFMHKAFRSDKAYHQKIKSPAEFVVGTIKALGVQKLDGDLPSVMARMGQNLFEPPNVKGWDGGLAWVATDTMMERFNFADRIASQKFDAREGYISPGDLAHRKGLKTTTDLVDYFLTLLVDDDVPKSARQHLLDYVSSDLNGHQTPANQDDKIVDAKMRGLIHLIMTLPSYQLA